MSLKLFGKEVLSDKEVQDHVNQYFDNFAIRYYDESQETDPYQILPVDVCITAVVNSRVGWKQVHSVMQHKFNIEKVLSQIPIEKTLTDNFNDSLKQNVHQLFKNTCVPYIGLSIASKILHKKRPSLVPMMDRNVQYHYRNIFQNNGHKVAEHSEKAILIMEHFRNDLSQNYSLLKSVIDADERLKQISPLRLLEALIWQLHNSKDGRNPVNCTACN